MVLVLRGCSSSQQPAAAAAASSSGSGSGMCSQRDLHAAWLVHNAAEHVLAIR